MRRIPHLLLVDDDPEIRRLLSRALERGGFRVAVAADGRAMAERLAALPIDLVLLDRMLPGEDGLSLCRRLRAERGPPVILLTAMAEEHQRVTGLEDGADDYVTKPFSTRELIARIRAVLRRSAAPAEPAPLRSGARVAFAGWRFDAGRRELHAPDGVRVELSAGEFDLLVVFLAHPQRVLNRDQLLELTRGRTAQPFDRTMDVQVSRLRRKIEADVARPTIIKTVRAGGYVFAPEVRALGTDEDLAPTAAIADQAAGQIRAPIPADGAAPIVAPIVAQIAARIAAAADGK
jgi:two-component system OmpR family response regulator